MRGTAEFKEDTEGLRFPSNSVYTDFVAGTVKAPWELSREQLTMESTCEGHVDVSTNTPLCLRHSAHHLSCIRSVPITTHKFPVRAGMATGFQQQRLSWHRQGTASTGVSSLRLSGVAGLMCVLLCSLVVCRSSMRCWTFSLPWRAVAAARRQLWTSAAAAAS